MIDRRAFLRGGLGAVAAGILSRHGRSAAWADSVLTVPAPRLKSGVYQFIPPSPKSVMVDGLPFAEWFTGDSFDNNGIPFHSCENCFPGGSPPAHCEDVDIVVAGGGISGLSTAYLLRNHQPVLLELHPRFGGGAQGEVWSETPYSLGNAYVITPDKGSFLEGFYQELGVDRVVRVDDEQFTIEQDGAVVEDFWKGQGFSPQEFQALLRYIEVVGVMADKEYPEIPLPEGKDNSWILDLDRLSLKEHTEMQMGVAAPPLLAAAIQAYCFSSFNAGWEEISAASGWNFLAAEEFGRWVFPGGTTYLAEAMWRRLSNLDRRRPAGRGPLLRANSRVVDVRLTKDQRVLVSFLDHRGKFQSIRAKRVAMCMPKHVARHVISDIENLDAQKAAAIQNIEYRGYVVANILLDAPVDRDFYDIFLLGEGEYPVTANEMQTDPFVTDVLSGHYARPNASSRSVLTLYWPIPDAASRARLINDNVWMNFATSLTPQVRRMLAVLNVAEKSVIQIRMTRWGHAMPLSAVGLIADGTLDQVRRPIDDKIFFVNQDNWALPAVENCLLDAEHFAPQITAGL